MEIGEVCLDGQTAEAWVEWKPGVDVLLAYLSPARDRDLLNKVMKPQFRGHQRSEDKVDLVAMRDFYCKEVIKGIRGLTKDGEPFEPTIADLKMIWDGNHDFGQFVFEASRDLNRFIEEKKLKS